MSSKYQAILFMVLSILCISIMDAIAKKLVSHYPVMPLLAVRAAMAVFLLTLYGVWRNGWRSFKTKQLSWHLVRMISAVAAPAFNFLALKDLPLTDATVIFFGAVFFVTALSWPVLGEKIGRTRTLAIIVGFVGVVIVMQPSFDSVRIGAAYALLSAFFYAIFILLSRKMSSSVGTFSLVYYGNVGVLIGGLLFVPSQWVPIPAMDFGWIFLMALAGLGSHILLVKAFSMAEVGTLAPFEYTGAMWAVVFGYFIFQEIPSLTVIIGGAVVILSGMIIIYREKREERQQRSEQILTPSSATD